jgi:tetratricopeptide (TPR) repeat protein
VAGRYDEAVEALETAISFDRRAENGYGLASDWLALGEVYAKAGKTAESGAAKERAAAIFKAIGLDAGGIKP